VKLFSDMVKKGRKIRELDKEIKEIKKEQDQIEREFLDAHPKFCIGLTLAVVAAIVAAGVSVVKGRQT
jgi:hypothetical protein